MIAESLKLPNSDKALTPYGAFIPAAKDFFTITSWRRVAIMPVLVIVWLASLLTVSAKGPAIMLPQDHALDLSGYDAKLVYENDFSRPQKVVYEENLIERQADGVWRRMAKPAPDAEWIAEGKGGCVVRDGKLWVAPTAFDVSGHPTPGARSHMVVWNQQVFPADFLLEFDMNPGGSTNGLALVFICATGTNGQDIFDLSMPVRRGEYAMYHASAHALANYSDSYWSRNKVPLGEGESNRLRKNPLGNIVAEGSSLTTGPTDITHHIRILKVGAHLAVEINGKVVNEWNDPAESLGAGRIGLRSMDGVTTIAYSNFKVWQLNPHSSDSSTSTLSVERFPQNPIIRPGMLPLHDGDDINGPSLIRVPSWIQNRLGNYYLYFAHHAGKYIRLAYADKLEGPWKIYTPGVLALADAPGCKGHIASPDVLVDEQQHALRMYFHGPAQEGGGQKTFLALSSDGLHFQASATGLGWPYFRVFQWQDSWYAVAKAGLLYHSPDGLTPFEAGQFLLPGSHQLGSDEVGARHVALHRVGDKLWVYYTNIGDMPERIFRSEIQLTTDWHSWKTLPAQEVLRPQTDYEGANLPLKKSHGGEVATKENALRDPAIFTDTDGRVYLLYAVAGEQGIAIAELKDGPSNITLKNSR